MSKFIIRDKIQLLGWTSNIYRPVGCMHIHIIPKIKTYQIDQIKPQMYMDINLHENKSVLTFLTETIRQVCMKLAPVRH